MIHFKGDQIELIFCDYRQRFAQEIESEITRAPEITAILKNYSIKAQTHEA
jgi:hypothetical protein